MIRSQPSPQTLDDATVRHVAHLARITISDAEVRLYAQQLSKILDYAAQLNELSTDDIPPTEHPLQASDVIRADVSTTCTSTEAALRDAPDRYGEYYRVPKVLEQTDA